MQDLKKNEFNKRAFIALTVSITGFGLPITGLANHLLQMEFMSFRRHACMAAHTCLGVLFLAFVIWHTVLNRRAFFPYVRGLYAHWPAMGREAFWAVVLVAVTLFIAVGHALLA